MISNPPPPREKDRLLLCNKDAAKTTQKSPRKIYQLGKGSLLNSRIQTEGKESLPGEIAPNIHGGVGGEGQRRENRAGA